MRQAKRTTYVMRNGKIVEKSKAAPLHASRDARVHVISDTCEVKSMADGRMYTSKSRYRADLRARNLVEVGNDIAAHLRTSEPSAAREAAHSADIRTDLRRSIEQLSSR